MIGFNGGLMGIRRTPTQGSASGLWAQNEQSVAQRAGIWPISGNSISALSPVLWYDFADELTVTTSNGQITQVTDKGSRGWTLTSSATGPTYATTINGRKVSDWGTSSHSNYLRNTSSTSTDIAEIYSVQDTSYTSSFTNYSSLLGSWTDTVGTIIVNGVGSGFAGPYNLNRAYMNGGITDVWSNLFPAIASPSLLRLTKNDGDVIATQGGFQIGMDRSFGNRGWSGLIGEVVVFSSVLSPADRNAVQTYLSIKWGITLV